MSGAVDNSETVSRTIGSRDEPTDYTDREWCYVIIPVNHNGYYDTPPANTEYARANYQHVVKINFFSRG